MDNFDNHEVTAEDTLTTTDKLDAKIRNVVTRRNLLLAERVNCHASLGLPVTYGVIEKCEFLENVNEYVRFKFNGVKHLESETSPESAFFKVRKDHGTWCYTMTPVNNWHGQPMAIGGSICTNAKLTDGDIIEITNMYHPEMFINWGGMLRVVNGATLSSLFDGFPGLSFTVTADRATDGQSICRLSYDPEKPLFKTRVPVDVISFKLEQLYKSIDELILRTSHGLLLYRSYVKPAPTELW